MTSWGKIAESLEDTANNQRIAFDYLSQHSQIILTLIPRIKETFQGYDLEPFLSHKTLCLSIRGKNGVLGIFAEAEDRFELELFARDNHKPIETLVCSDVDLFHHIRHYLESISVDEQTEDAL